MKPSDDPTEATARKGGKCRPGRRRPTQQASWDCGYGVLQPAARAATLLTLACLAACACAALLSAGCAARAPGSSVRGPTGLSGPRAVVEEILARPELATTSIGVHAVRCRSGDVLLSYNAEKLLPGASNVKLASGAGALLALGPDFRFETHLVATGPVEDGALRGDLVLVASGDPNLSQRVAPGDRLLFEDRDHSYAGFSEARAVPGDPLAVIRDLAQQVVQRGVRRIEGDVVVDDGLFRAAFDDFVGAVSAVCVNDNLLDVTIQPGKTAGEPARIDWAPRSEAIRVRSEATTVEEGGRRALWVEAEPTAPVASAEAEATPAGTLATPSAPGDLESRARARFVVRGQIPAGSRPTLRVASFREPARVAAGLLAAELRAAGVEVSGTDRRATLGPAAYEDDAVLARHLSPPFSEALRVILKTSQNLHATMLPPLVGALRGAGGSREEGYRVMGRSFAERGLDPGDVALETGSGGGRADLLSARWTAALLSALAQGGGTDASAEFSAYFAALPSSGVDGTLRESFVAPELRGRVHAKTGTLVYGNAAGGNWAFLSKSLSGYLDPAGQGRPEDLISFSIILAGTLADDRAEGARRLVRAQEEILRALLEAAR